MDRTFRIKYSLDAVNRKKAEVTKAEKEIIDRMRDMVKRYDSGFGFDVVDIGLIESSAQKRLELKKEHDGMAVIFDFLSAEDE